MANLSKLAQAQQIAAHNAEIKSDIETLAVMLNGKRYITNEAQEILKKYLPVESETAEHEEPEPETETTIDQPE